jgi:hypothetical protein
MSTIFDCCCPWREGNGQRMRAPLRARIPIGAAALLCISCGTATEAVPLPEPFISAVVSGPVSDSLFGEPIARRFPAVIDAYEFEIYILFWRPYDVERYLGIVVEGPRPRVGRYAITPWRQGINGQRAHAYLESDGSGTHYSMSGELVVTVSTPEGIAGTFEFHGVYGINLLDSIDFASEIPGVDVRGSFAVRCAGDVICR